MRLIGSCSYLALLLLFGSAAGQDTSKADSALSSPATQPQLKESLDDIFADLIIQKYVPASAGDGHDEHLKLSEFVSLWANLRSSTRNFSAAGGVAQCNKISRSSFCSNKVFIKYLNI